MKYRRILSIALAVIFMMAVMTGCGGGQTTSEVGTVKVQVTLTDSQIEFEKDAKAIVNEYIALRLATMSIGDSESWESKDDLSSKVAELSSRYEALAEASELLEKAADKVSDEASKAEMKELTDDTAFSPLSLTAYAAESTDRAKEWAEEITKAYDSYPTGKQLRGLAAYLGTDCRTAMKKLEVAQGIMENEYENEADMWDDMADVAQVIQTTCKVELCVAGIGSTGLNTLKDAGLALISSVDTLIAVGSTGSEIILGENDNLTLYMGMLKEVVAPISSVTGLLTFNSPDTGIADRIAYIGDSLNDLIFEGKIFGGLIDANDAATSFNAALYSTIELAEAEGYSVREVEEILSIMPETIKIVDNDSIKTREDMAPAIEEITESLEKLAEISNEEPEKDEPAKEPVSLDIEGTYDITSVEMIEDGSSNEGDGAIVVKMVDSNTISILNESSSESETMEMSYDPETMTAEESYMDGQAIYRIVFDGKGNLEWNMINNNDGKLYIRIQGKKK